MIEKTLNNKLPLIFAHIFLGFLVTLPFAPIIYSLLCVVVPIYLVVNTKNRNEEALILSAYLVGGEVLMRMTKGFVFYETGKYAVILLLLLGLVYGKFKQKFSIQYIFYLLLLLLGIVFTQVPEGESIRKAVLFNLSGPIGLGIAAIYFYKRPITRKQIMDSMFVLLLPLFSTVTYLYFRTPDVSEIVFGGDANFEASGGFGPNQVATVIGMGVFIITISIISKVKITGYIILDIFFLIYFSYRGLLTFSRGGIATAIVAVVSFCFFYIIYKKINAKVLFKYFFVVSFFLLSLWLYTSDVTGGMLNNRYTGKNAIGVQKDITSGRTKIFSVQFDNFLENPLGIGVGNGKYKRLDSTVKVTAASHNEVGRLLEEHGYIGFFLLILLMSIPFFNFFRGDFYQKGFILSFYLIWFLTINHSAMRIALPGFIYALSLIRITNYEEEDV